MTRDKDELVAPMIEECRVLSDVSVMPIVYALREMGATHIPIECPHTHLRILWDHVMGVK